MSKPIMPQEFYKKVNVNAEDELVLAFAQMINHQHMALLYQTEMEIDNLLSNKDLKKLEAAKQQQLTRLCTIQDILHNENISEAQNPYGIYTTAQRLFYLNQNLISEIKIIRAKTDLNDNKKLVLLSQKYEQLTAALTINLNNSTQEILDVAKRRVVFEELYQAYKSRGLLHQLELNKSSDKFEYFKLSMDGGEILASATKVILLLTKQLAELAKGAPIVSGGFGLLGTLATLIVSGHEFMTAKDKISMHHVINTVFGIIAGFMHVSARVLETVKELGSKSLAQHLGWAPLVGSAATLILLGVEISNIIKTEVNYNNDLKLFNQLVTQTDDTDWLQAGVILTKDEKELKEALLKKISIKEVNKYPEAIKSLFTKEEFLNNLSPSLIQHATTEYNKLLNKHYINASILLTLLVASLLAFFIPAFMMNIAVLVVIFVAVTFVAKLIIYRTLLKEREYTDIKDFQADVIKTKPNVDGEVGLLGSFFHQFDEAVCTSLQLDIDKTFNKPLSPHELPLFSEHAGIGKMRNIGSNPEQDQETKGPHL